MKTLIRQKKKHTQSIEILFFLMVLLSVFFAVYLNMTRIKATVDWKEIEFKTDMDSMFVLGVNAELLGIYQTEENDEGRTFAASYVAQNEDGYLIGVRFEGEDMEKAEALMNAQMDCASGKLTKEELEGYLFEIQGWLEPMQEQECAHYQYALGWSELSDAEQQLCLPYLLTIKSAEDVKFDNIVFGGVILLCFFLWFSLWIKSHTMIGEKMIRAYIKNSGNALYAKERISQFFETAQVEPDFWLDSSYVAGLFEGNAVFGESSELVWVYLLESETPMSGNIAADVAVAATKSISPVKLMLVFTDKKGHIVTLNGGKKSAERLLDRIDSQYPWVITEYSDELEHLYKKNWEGFLGIAYYPNQKEE
ncbi:MAG: hypothetical protein IJP29_04090 [Lachnospiraceae bacterium]|nr:hypothetical protein [Lachnospiraceae bacterium]